MNGEPVTDEALEKEAHRNFYLDQSISVAARDWYAADQDHIDDACTNLRRAVRLRFGDEVARPVGDPEVVRLSGGDVYAIVSMLQTLIGTPRRTIVEVYSDLEDARQSLLFHRARVPRCRFDVYRMVSNGWVAMPD